MSTTKRQQVAAKLARIQRELRELADAAEKGSERG